MSSTIAWKRGYSTIAGAKIFNNNQANFVDDIDQGSLGDCYYLAGLSALGEFPDTIKSRVKTQTTNAAGIFAVDVFIKGKPTTVVIDDLLPFHKTYGWLVFDHQKDDGTMWGPLMEKVWAKINGNYEFIIGGNSFETFNLLLGSPTIYYDRSWADIGFNSADATTWGPAAETAWNLISAADVAGNIMSSSVGSTNNVGLVGNHAYTLIGTRTLTTEAGLVKLYKIRNPWGTDVYTGDWRDSDTTHWTTSAKSQVDYASADDGIIFVDHRDFIQNFYGFQISHYQPSY